MTCSNFVCRRMTRSRVPVGHFSIALIAATAATAVDTPMKNEVKIACSVLSQVDCPSMPGLPMLGRPKSRACDGSVPARGRSSSSGRVGPRVFFLTNLRNRVVRVPKGRYPRWCVCAPKDHPQWAGSFLMSGSVITVIARIAPSERSTAVIEAILGVLTSILSALFNWLNARVDADKKRYWMFDIANAPPTACRKFCQEQSSRRCLPTRAISFGRGASADAVSVGSSHQGGQSAVVDRISPC